MIPRFKPIDSDYVRKFEAEHFFPEGSVQKLFDCLVLIAASDADIQKAARRFSGDDLELQSCTRSLLRDMRARIRVNHEPIDQLAAALAWQGMGDE